jgi:hypothetical protein
MQFNFNFGKKKPDKKQIIIVSIVTTAIIGTLSQCTGISDKTLWDLFDEVQRKFFPQTIFNELVIQDPEKLGRRISRDVDRAIDDYWSHVPKEQPRMKNKNILNAIQDKSKYSDTQRKIVEDAIYYEFKDGTMGIRGVWVPPDPREIDLGE